jgi:hypothetical protein
MAAEACIECDVAIVGAGFAGALIANELGKARKKVVVLEAGDPVPPNINDFMRRFYMAPAKVPESPYTPEIFDAAGNLSDPSKMNAGRPTVLSLLRKGGFGDWTDPKRSYLIQKGPRPFASTYDRIAGGTANLVHIFNSPQPPLQKFLWWDGGINDADRGKTFKYTITPVRGTGPKDLVLQHDAETTISVTLLRVEEDGIATWFSEFPARVRVPWGSTSISSTSWLMNTGQFVVKATRAKGCLLSSRLCRPAAPFGNSSCSSTCQ